MKDKTTHLYVDSHERKLILHSLVELKNALIMQRRRLAAIKHFLNQKMQNKENCVMKELAKRFIGEECIIYTITSNDGSVQGLIKEIDDGGMVVEKKTGELEIINLDFVTRIRQYPRKKNGKKKDIVLD